MVEKSYNNLAQSILAIPKPETPWHKQMLKESDALLGHLEQLNLDEKVTVPYRLKKLMSDFCLHYNFTLANGTTIHIAISDRLTVTEGLHLIYKCQAMILGQEEDDE